MKGFVFTEFLEMVEEAHGYELVDKMLLESHLPSGGNYTSVGTYDHAEMMALVNKLSEHLNVPVSQLLRAYGRYMFSSFKRDYGIFISRSDSAFSLLSSIQQYIHVEVRKLYPDAELPHFTITQSTPGRLIMHYESERKLADFARGLIEGCLAHFGEEAEVAESRVAEDGGNVIFEITKKGEW
ncbi:heme NO-binding domain-containing protein [Fibrella sp. WM1]|uniref:heme NO-binding domain-containing protein n=1 Tax=Fibrella musci TaxID=3242485 RepID=UPI00352102B5